MKKTAFCGRYARGSNRYITKTLLVMKLTIILLTGVFLNVSAEGVSQRINFSGKNVSVQTVLAEVEKQTGYLFAYDKAALENVRSVSISVNDVPLKQFLDKLFKNQPVDFAIRSKTILLSRKASYATIEPKHETGSLDELFLPITGVVKDSKGNPLAGVAVTVKGSDKGTATDVNGSFFITVPGNDAVLVFTHIGYQTQEVAAGGRSTINVRLEVSVQELSDVMITVPYGRQTKSSYTGAATTIQSETLSERPRISFIESLQGNVPGLQISQGSGQPGAEVAIRLRGIGSINASNNPLFVVDGIPIGEVGATAYAWSSNPLATINPNDIQDITVLKDASATSIYGSRGANGVILITTKRGASGKSKIEISAQKGTSDVTMKDRNKPLNTKEMAELLVEGVLNNPAFGISTPEDARAFLVAEGVNPDFDANWWDRIIRKGNYEQYNLSVSGGNEKTNIFLSGGYYKQEAVVKGIGYERMNARLNITHQANDWLSVSGNMAASYQDMNTFRAQWWGENPIRNLRLTSPWANPYNADGSYNTAVTFNNEVLINENKRNSKIYQMLGNIGAEIKIIDPLSFETKISADFNYGDEDLYWDPLWIDGQSLNGLGGNYLTKVLNWNITNLLKYRQRFGDIGVEATLGQEAQQVDRKRTAAEKYDFVSDKLYTLDAAAQMAYSGSALDGNTLTSYFLNTSFNYKSRYYLNLTARRDGSSRFGGNKQYGNFGSVGVSWNMQEEAFIKDLAIINQLKLRTSYGVNGNLPSSWYPWKGTYGAGYNYYNSPGFAQNSIENANLTWEKNKSFNIGLDFAILDQRLTGTFDYYTRTTDDLLMGVNVSYTNGVPDASFVNDNVGSMKNSGIELSLTSQNITSAKADGFNWRTSFNITTLKNVVKKIIPNPLPDGFFIHEEGYDFYQFYLKGWAGVDPATGEGQWYTDDSKKATTKNYNEAGFFKQGSATPNLFGALTNTLDLKRFSLSFQLYYNWGNKLFDNYGRFTQSDGSLGYGYYSAMDRVQYENRWRQPGDVTNVPKVVVGGSQTNSNQNSTRYLYDGSYIRLRDITLSYSLPVKRLVNVAQVYIRGNNLFTYIKDDVLPYDPEGYIGGLNNGQVPVSRQVLVGLNLTF